MTDIDDHWGSTRPKVPYCGSVYASIYPRRDSIHRLPLVVGIWHKLRKSARPRAGRYSA